MWGRKPRGPESNTPAQPGTSARAPRPVASELLQYAYGLLSRRAYSEREVRERLERRLKTTHPEVPPEEHPTLLEGVMEKLREYRFVDDSKLAESLARSRGLGQHRLQAKMLERGIERSTAGQALRERDPDQEQHELERLVERHWSRWQSAGPKGHSRAYAFLARRGFSSRAILNALEDLRSSSMGSELDPDALEE